MSHDNDEIAQLRAGFANLAARVELLEAERPGRKKLPIVVKEHGVCGVDPSMTDSATCPHASLYRRQQGCQGLACERISSEYYKGRRKK
jgi:hypothetical protein